MRQRTGSVVEDKKTGKIYARVTFTDEFGRKRNLVRQAKSRSDARAIIKKLHKEIDEGGTKAIDGARMTVADLCDHYKDTYCKPAKYVDGRKVAGLRDVRHVERYVKTIRDHFCKRLLRSLTFGDLLAFKSRRLSTPTHNDKQRSIASVNRELEYFRRMLNIAHREGWITRNPFAGGETLISKADERKRERIITKAEEERLLARCVGARCHLRAIIICALDTGMRKAEILKLTWQDIDFASRIITIQALNTKTLCERQVAITNRLCAELERLRGISGINQSASVFGVKYDIWQGFTNVANEAGLTGLRFHDLRHTAATRLIEGGLSVQLTGRILGHTQTETTYRYINANHTTAMMAAAIFDRMTEGEFIN